MKPLLVLHRPRVYAVEPPRVGPPSLAFGFAVVLAFVFGTVATAALTQRYPDWMVEAGFPGNAALRATILAVSAINGLASVLVASAYGLKTWSLVGHRLGWYRVMESEGPCRLVQVDPGLWGLQLELQEGEDPGAPWPLTSAREPAGCGLFFRLDEAGAGAVSHLFSPNQVLQVRWLDLPIVSGGPTLLEIRSPIREETTSTSAAEREKIAA